MRRPGEALFRYALLLLQNLGRAGVARESERAPGYLKRWRGDFGGGEEVSCLYAKSYNDIAAAASRSAASAISAGAVFGGRYMSRCIGLVF